MLLELEADVVPLKMWSPSSLHQLNFVSPYSILFGAFQVLDVHIEQRNLSSRAQNKTNSYIDFGYGSTPSGFAGSHRFSIFRDSSDRGDAVTIEFADLVCNPTVNQPVRPAILMAFHKVYAMLLFKEAVATVLAPL